MIVEAGTSKYITVYGAFPANAVASIEFKNKNNVVQTVNSGRVRGSFAEFFVSESLLSLANLPATAKFKVNDKVVKEETFSIASSDAVNTELTEINSTVSDLSETVSGLDAKTRLTNRIRNLGGYKAPTRKCPLTKATVSVATALDGYVAGGVTYKVQDLQNVAECSWKPEHVFQYVAANLNYYGIMTGPWSTGETVASNQPGNGKIAKPFDFTFMLEGNYIALSSLFVNGVWAQDTRIWIDDEEIENWYLGTRAAGTLQNKSTITPSALGTGTHIYNINFAERGLYKIRVYGLVTTMGGATQGAATVGNIMTANPNSRVLKPAPRANVGVISDSFFESITANTSLTPAASLGAQLNVNIWNLAMGGSGFVNPSGNNVNGDKSFPSNLVWQAVARCPSLDLLIINGSANDMGYTNAQVEAAMKATFDRARAYRADIPIVWIGVEPGGYFKNIYTLAAMKARETFQLAIANADPNVVLAIPTCNEEWMTGTGRVGATTSDGNQDFVVGADAVHLSPYGTDFMGKMIAERMKSALVGGK